jgi:hypothetical protein
MRTFGPVLPGNAMNAGALAALAENGFREPPL